MRNRAEMPDFFCRYATFHTPSPGSLEKGVRILHGVRGRSGEGMNDVVDELKFLFFN